MRQVDCEAVRNVMRFSLLFLLTLSAGYLVWLFARPRPLPLPGVTIGFKSPYQKPLLTDHERLFRAELRGDTGVLERFVDAAPDSYLRYRTLLKLARNHKIPVGVRLGYLEQVLTFELISPLARNDVKRAQLELGRLAEAAGAHTRAATAYEEALPLEAATMGLARLDLGPRRLARIFLDARDPARALDVLKGVSAPELRAPALAAAGEPLRALRIYNRLLTARPDDAETREGKFSVLLSLSRYRQAEALLPLLTDPLEAQVRLAEAEGDLEAALAAYLELGSQGDDRSLWLAAGLLEARNEASAALPLYLQVARGDSDYNDDAAFRAYTIATRLGDAATADEADALIPAGSFFGLVRGKPLPAFDEPLAWVEPPVLELSRALLQAGDPEAALGELLMALPQSGSEATTVALAEALQNMGEFGSSSLAASSYLQRGSRARRTYRAAYPQAFRHTVLEQARAHSLPPALIWAVMRQESLFYPRAVSVSDAQGLLQLIPSTWDYVAELLGEPPGDPFYPGDNIRYGAFYLSRLLEQFDGRLPESVAAYNGGPGYVGRLLLEPTLTASSDFYPDFYRAITRDETREYVSRVMFNYAVYTELYGLEQGRSRE